MSRTVALVDLLHGGRFRKKHLSNAVIRFFQVLKKVFVHFNDLDEITHQLCILIQI